MALQTFDFSNFTMSTQYPDEPGLPTFGGGWAASVESDTPLQRKFILKTQGLKYYLQGDGSLDVTTNPLRNMGRLEQFYEFHRTSQKFIFPHPYKGDINVRFIRPIEIPEALRGGDGAMPEIAVELVEDLTS